MDLYLIVTEEGIGIPQLLGPFQEDTSRQVAASEVMEQDDKEYILLDVEGGVPQVGQYVPRVERPCLGPPVTAWAWSDDHVIEDVEFDAAPWFYTTEDHIILALANEGWECGPASDEVVESLRNVYPELHNLFQYVESVNKGRSHVEVSCGVSKDGAMYWLRKHGRNSLVQIIEEG